MVQISEITSKTIWKGIVTNASGLTRLIPGSQNQTALRRATHLRQKYRGSKWRMCQKIMQQNIKAVQ